MPLFYISYDLRKKKDYQKLYDKLKEFNAVRVLESLWAFNRINTTAEKLRDYFKPYVDSDDGLIVIESAAWGSWNADGDPNKA